MPRPRCTTSASTDAGAGHRRLLGAARPGPDGIEATQVTLFTVEEVRRTCKAAGGWPAHRPGPLRVSPWRDERPSLQHLTNATIPPHPRVVHLPRPAVYPRRDKQVRVTNDLRGRQTVTERRSCKIRIGYDT